MHALLAEHYSPLGRSRDKLATLRATAMESATLTEEVEQVERDFALYESVMGRYIAQDSVRGTILHVEEFFEVPLPGGGRLKIKPDLLVEGNGGIWLHDHKTVQDFDRDMELRADFDPQLSFYVWGLRQIGIPVTGAVHNFIRMRLPAIPKINKDGSMSRAFVITDEQTVREFVAQSGAKIEPAALEAYIARLPQQAFFRQIVTVRSDAELEAISQEIVEKVRKRDALVTPTRTLIRECVRCPFFRPCIAGLKGGDEEALLAEGYRSRASEEEDDLPVDYIEEGEHDGSGTASLLE